MQYPIEVHYVFQYPHDENDPILRKIQEFCSLMKIQFQIREFDSRKFSEDRDYITRLPAIQIYTDSEYDITEYPSNNPILAIRTVYETFELKHLEYLAKKQIWDEKLNFLKRIFKRDSLKTDSINPKASL